MNCCHCEATERHFDQTHVEENLDRYLRKGTDNITKILLDGLKAQNLQGAALLDIGGGIGIISHELLAGSVTSATLVEAASSYLKAAEAEAQRRGHHERVKFVYGDFVQLVEQLPDADLVTLDRVVCCYPDFERLVTESAAKARKWYALSYPRNKWYVRIGNAFENWRRRRRANLFRTYIHSERRIHELLLAVGFDRQFHQRTFTWQATIYARKSAA
jgi:magnesium-protoporphyrin O-methyltransferase